MTTAGILGAAAIAGLASAVGSGMNSYSANMANKWNRREAEKNRQWQEEQWMKQNDYNLPINQLSRLKDAGLNPNLALGQSGLSNVASSFGSGSQAQQISPQYGDTMHGVSSALDTYMNLMMNKANIRNLESDSDNKDAQAGLSKWQLQYNRDTEAVMKSILENEDLAGYEKYKNLAKDYAIKTEKYEQERVNTSKLQAEEKLGFPSLKIENQKFQELVQSWNNRLKKFDLENQEIISRMFLNKWKALAEQAGIKFTQAHERYMTALAEGQGYTNELLGEKANYKEAFTWLEMINLGADAFDKVIGTLLPTGKIGKAFKMVSDNKNGNGSRYDRRKVTYSDAMPTR